MLGCMHATDMQVRLCLSLALSLSLTHTHTHTLQVARTQIVYRACQGVNLLLC